MNATDPQTEMTLRTAHRTPAQKLSDARALEDLLRGRDWVTRRRIEMERPEWRDADDEGRYVRALAEISGNIVSGPGLPGYRLADETTLEDSGVDAALSRAAFAGVAQMRAMAKRVRHYRTVLGLRAALRKRLEGVPS